MVKVLRVEDDVHKMLKQLAQEDERTLMGYLNVTIKQLHEKYLNRDLERYEQMVESQKNTPLPKNTNVQNLRGKQFASVEIVERFETGKPSEIVMVNGVEIADKNKSGATPDSVSDLFTDKPSGEQACCGNETQPCTHWVWDTATGDGYINKLSNRTLEVE